MVAESGAASLSKPALSTTQPPLRRNGLALGRPRTNSIVWIWTPLARSTPTTKSGHGFARRLAYMRHASRRPLPDGHHERNFRHALAHALDRRLIVLVLQKVVSIIPHRRAAMTMRLGLAHHEHILR